METPTELYVAGGDYPQQSKIFHTRRCNGRLENANVFEATEETVAFLVKLGYRVCDTCSARAEKEMKLDEHRLVLDAYGVTALAIPPDLELRVYWHREGKTLTQIWSSKGAAS